MWVLRNIPSAAQHFWRFMSILDVISTDGVSPPYLALGEQLQESEANEKTCHNFNYSHHKWFCWIWNMSRQQRCLCLSVTGVVGTLLGMTQPDNQVPKARIDWLTDCRLNDMISLHSTEASRTMWTREQIPKIVKSASKCEINFVKLMN